MSITPTVYGEDTVIGIPDKENLSEDFKTLNLDILGFSQHEPVKLRRISREPYGRFLVTGYKGSRRTDRKFLSALSEHTPARGHVKSVEGHRVPSAGNKRLSWGRLPSNASGGGSEGLEKFYPADLPGRAVRPWRAPDSGRPTPSRVCVVHQPPIGG